MLKGNSGVTLVALVITIIVLLILAGVSISLVVGDNGIFSQATSAADATNAAKVKEQMTNALNAVIMDYFSIKSSTGTSQTLDQYITENTLSTNLDSSYTVSLGDFSGSPASATVTVTYEGNEYVYVITLSESGNNATLSDVE